MSENHAHQQKKKKKIDICNDEKTKLRALYGMRANQHLYGEFNCPPDVHGSKDEKNKNPDQKVAHSHHHKKLPFKERIIISSESKYKNIFEVVILLLVGYSCVTSMLYTAFAPPTDQVIIVFDEIIEYLFMLDLAVNFITGYKDTETYTEVKDLKKIARKYIFKGWFFVDFISVFPFKWFVSSD